MFDAIVVGARCAGSPTAMLLARKGYRVLLVDKARFPSDTLSTHYIHQPGIARLKRWGLLDRIVDSNCPPVRNLTVDLGPFALNGSAPPLDGVDAGYAPRRMILDEILVNSAISSGAEFREHFGLQELLMDGDTVTGIRGRTEAGNVVDEKARIVIGADGLRSAVARGVAATTYNVRPTLSCAYYTYFSDVPYDGGELYPRPGQMIITVPTNDNLLMTAVFWPNSEFHQVRSDIEGSFMRALDLAPDLAERIRGGRRVERFRGTADLRNQFRRSHGPGWALAGDAGYHKDPITAQGISDSFLSADLLADAIDDGLSGRVELQTALATYEATRNQMVMPMYELTCEYATLQPPASEQQALMMALTTDSDGRSGFFGAITGTVPIPEFFSPENIDKIMQRSGALPSPAAS
ncbi:MAG: NAD(P)/FAD-dependent oxidoreductase [Nitrolancea sp.]